MTAAVDKVLVALLLETNEATGHLIGEILECNNGKSNMTCAFVERVSLVRPWHVEV